MSSTSEESHYEERGKGRRRGENRRWRNNEAWRGAERREIDNQDGGQPHHDASAGVSGGGVMPWASRSSRH
jgi:hypothetical protein